MSYPTSMGMTGGIISKKQKSQTHGNCEQENNPKLDGLRLESIEKAAETMRKYLNEKYKNGSSWLLSELETICARTEKDLDMHSFVFEKSHEAAEWNKRVLEENDNNYEKTVKTQPNTVLSPGSEFRPTLALKRLLGHRKDWNEIEKTISEGTWYPMSEDVDNDTRIQDVRAMIQRGNHKSATKSTSRSIVKKRYAGEVDRSWMIPIPIKYIEFLDEASVIPLGVAFQTSINEEGEIIDKPRITHDMSFPSQSGTSVNIRTIESLLTECIYGQCLRRILHRIHSMRQKYPTTEILLSKFDLDAAYRRLHSHPKHAVKVITIVEKLAYLLIRLPFGSAAGPSRYSTVSESIMDLVNDLVHEMEWDPKTLHSPHSEKLAKYS